MQPRFASLFTLALLVSAGALHATAGWTNGTAKVTNILWRPDLKGFYVDPTTMDDPGNCFSNVPKSTLYELSPAVTSDAERNRLMAILLTAKGDGSRLHVWVDGCGAYGPLFTGLQLN